MSRRSKRKRKRKPQAKTGKPGLSLPSMSWFADDGLHVIAPGPPPSAEVLAGMTRIYQAKIRSSPLWAQIVEEVGEEEAERMLEQCRVELR